MSTPNSRMTSMTSGCTWPPGSATLPADSELWRPPAAWSNSAWLICERPALCRQTTTWASGGRLCGQWCLVADELVGERADRGAHDRPHDTDPEVVPRARRERGAKRACGVHARPGDATADEDVEQHDSADGDRRAGADGASVGGHGHDHEHQQRTENCLDDQRGAGADADRVGTEVARLV